VGLGSEGREVSRRDVSSVTHDRHATAQALRGVELVGRHEDRGPCAGHCREALLQQVLPGGVDPDQRFVEDEDRGLV